MSPSCEAYGEVSCVSEAQSTWSDRVSGEDDLRWDKSKPQTIDLPRFNALMGAILIRISASLLPDAPRY